MDEAFRVEVRNLKKLPDMVTTEDAITLHRLMAEVLKARSFYFNWLLESTFYDNGSPLIVFVEQHLQRVNQDNQARHSAFMFTNATFSEALTDIRNRVKLYRVDMQVPQPGETEEYEYDDGDIGIRPAQPKQVFIPVSLDDLPERGATYAIRIQE